MSLLCATIRPKFYCNYCFWATRCHAEESQTACAWSHSRGVRVTVMTSARSTICLSCFGIPMFLPMTAYHFFFVVLSSTADTTAVPLKIRKVAGRSLCREQTKISIHLRGWYQHEDVRANNVSPRRKEYSEKVCAKERRYNIFRRFNSVARGSWDLGDKIHFIRETLLIYTSKRNAL